MSNPPKGAREDEERGFLRDEGERGRPGPKNLSQGRPDRLDDARDPVVSPKDGRHPAAPDTLDADKGQRKAEENANRETLDTDELRDAYSQNDPGVRTKE